MFKIKSPKNKTISLSNEEILYYSNFLMKIYSKINDIKEILNKTINQDIFEIIDFLPEKFVDLMIIDPPYNINKCYNSIKFKKMKLIDYYLWFDSWFKKIIKVLKPTASVYICSDRNLFAADSPPSGGE